MENGRLVEKQEGYEELGREFWVSQERVFRKSNWLEARISDTMEEGGHNLGAWD